MVSGGPGESIMQCHCTSDDRPAVCVGFALQVGGDCLSFRFAVIRGLIDPRTLGTDQPLHTLASIIRHHGGRPPRGGAESRGSA